MNTPLQLIRLDEIEIAKHFDLNANDSCYYWRKYTTGKDYKFGESNQLIKNFRIPILELHRLSYKRSAIEQIANEFIKIAPKDSTYTNYTFIPIPTSNGRENNDYDDRLIQTLTLISKLKKIKMDIRELIIQKKRTPPAHTLPVDKRPTINELYELYTIQENLVLPTPTSIIIFDDVLTKGTHFKAMEKKLKIIYPHVPIFGLFVACSAHPDDISIF